MKIQTAELKNKLKLLKPVLETKSQNTALQGILFKDNTLTAYNLEVAITAKLDTNVDDTYIIPPKAIDIIQSITDEYVELNYEKGSLCVIFGKSKSKYQTVDVAEYPQIPTYQPDAEITQINALTVVDGIRKCVYAVAQTEQNPIFTGVFFNSEDEKLDVVACDGVRLALYTVAYDKPLNFTVPRKTLSIIQSLTIGKDDVLAIITTSKHIIFNLNEYCIISRTLSGNFIDYKGAIPSHKINITASRTKLIDIFNRINMLQAGAKSFPARVTFNESDIFVEINIENSEYNDIVSAKTNITKSVTIGVNAHYMTDCLKSFSEEDITFNIGSPLEPILVTSDNQKALVLPIRLKVQ